MPTYQYACTECAHQLEAVQAFTDAPLAECPECAGRLRKVFSSVGVVFKGSGFYRTDSRKGTDAAKSESSSSSDSGSTSSESSKSAGTTTSSSSSSSTTSSSSSSSTATAASAA